MSQEPGDRVLGHGDQDTRTNNSGSKIEQGMWVVPTGDDNVDKADVNGSGGSLVGVTSDPIADSGYGRVHYRGLVLARVDSGVTAGAELGAPDSAGSGTPGVAVSGGSSGIYAVTDAKDPEGNSEYYATVLIR